MHWVKLAIMGSHNVTCHPTQANTPRLNHSQWRLVLDLRPRKDERLSWPRWLVAYRDKGRKPGGTLGGGRWQTAFGSKLLTRTVEDKNNKKAVLSQRWPRDARYISRSCCRDMAIRNYPRWRRTPSWICSNRNGAIRSAVPRKPHSITKHEVDRTTCCVCWEHMEPPFLGRRGRRG